MNDVKLLVDLIKELGSYCYTQGVNQVTSIMVFEVGDGYHMDIKLPKAEAERVEELING